MIHASFGIDGLNAEYKCGKMIADRAVQKGAEYIVFSTLPPVKEISGSKYTNVPFDANAKVEEPIRGLHIKSILYMPLSFMESFKSQTFLDNASLTLCSKV